MKKLILGLSFIFLFLFSSVKVFSQEITKYKYLEVIVVQKTNNSGKIKRIKVEEQDALDGEKITIKEMENIEGTATLLNYMNAANWEFLERQSVVSSDSDPVWMSYIFRKEKQ